MKLNHYLKRQTGQTMELKEWIVAQSAFISTPHGTATRLSYCKN